MIAAGSFSKRAACLARIARISATMGSLLCVFISCLHELARRTDLRWFVSGVSAHLFDLVCGNGICNVAEVPSRRILHSVHHCDGNMRGSGWQGMHSGQCPCQSDRLVTRIERGQGFRHRQPIPGRHLRPLQTRARKLPVQTVPPHRATTLGSQSGLPISRHHVTSERPTSSPPRSRHTPVASFDHHPGLACNPILRRLHNMRDKAAVSFVNEWGCALPDQRSSHARTSSVRFHHRDEQFP